MMKLRGISRMVLLAAVVVAAQGCLVIEHGDARADLTLLWDYEGLDCVRAGVNRTAVEIFDFRGQVVQQVVPCDAAGVTFRDFPTGYHDFRLFGLSPSGRVIYEAEGGMDVFGGDNVFNIRLRFAR
ncbi:MAG: hypothetical protein ACK4N5_08805 [Myxococcales bacterium]